jgi:uroporphyrinogen-III synthase
MKYFCVSEAVALYLQKYIQYRKRKIFFSPTGKFTDLSTLLNKHSDEKFLYITSDIRNDETMSCLENCKIAFSQAIMYKTVSNDFQEGENIDYDMFVFFSPAGIQSLIKNFPSFKQDEIQIACFGATTAQAVKDAGLRLDLEAPTKEFPSMTMALDNFLKENAKKEKAKK